MRIMPSPLLILLCCPPRTVISTTLSVVGDPPSSPAPATLFSSHPRTCSCAICSSRCCVSSSRTSVGRAFAIFLAPSPALWTSWRWIILGSFFHGPILRSQLCLLPLMPLLDLPSLSFQALLLAEILLLPLPMLFFLSLLLLLDLLCEDLCLQPLALFLTFSSSPVHIPEVRKAMHMRRIQSRRRHDNSLMTCYSLCDVGNLHVRHHLLLVRRW
mmetsp:Transcript_35/g.64  ORF Transcript_35/g.64 Transcript_35/m.64 type:complete len:214 (+) Transcript_35:1600-2241(+)